MRYLISYDLNKPGQKHADLAKELRKKGAMPVLDSQWVLLCKNSNAETVLKHFHSFLDSNDKMLVVCFDSIDWHAVPRVFDTKIQVL